MRRLPVVAILVTWFIFFSGTLFAADRSDSLAVVVTLDPITYDLPARAQVYEASVTNPFSSSPSGALDVYVEDSQPTEIGSLIDTNIALDLPAYSGCPDRRHKW